MAGITLAQAEAQLTSWLDASTAVANNQAYQIEGRTLTRVNAQHIDRMIKFWDTKVQVLTAAATRGRTRYAVPG